MIEMLIMILILCVIAYVAFWIVDTIGLPHPINMIVKAVIGILVLYAILQRSGLM